MVSALSIKDIYAKGLVELIKSNIQSPSNECMALICHILQCDKSYVHTYPDKLLSKDQILNFENALNSRCKHVPFQYITGFQEFMSLNFHVNQSVLIPRPETELLVETILNIYSENKNKLTILDIGTGSGCISVSLAKYLPTAFITAIDISTDALAIAKKNALYHELSDRINFVESNLFENIYNKQFDVIVSNPPYIPSEDIPTLMPEVRHFEPTSALNGGKNGFMFYEKIIQNSPKYLCNQGILAFEVGITQAMHVKSLMVLHFKEIHIKKDLANIDRVVWGRLIPSK